MFEQRHTGALARSQDAHCKAYNAAFFELGLGWCWDDDTHEDLQRIPGEKDRICAYAEGHQAHVLKAYEIGFLSNLVYETNLRCFEQLARRAGQVTS